MFLQFLSQNNSQLETLLKKDNITIEEILNEDDVLTNITGQAGKMIANFLSKNQNELVKCINYALVYDELETDIKGVKYPFLCSEILGTNTPSLQDIILNYPN